MTVSMGSNLDSSWDTVDLVAGANVLKIYYLESFFSNEFILIKFHKFD